VTFGFLGSWTTANAKPTAFSLNSTTCSAAGKQRRADPPRVRPPRYLDRGRAPATVRSRPACGPPRSGRR
jgi:hypothetical protein